ncbi:hypothetical protein OUZ56_003380 [Daphnia magna]|uniref:Uncharacterized protein n=1 Tax=Daphnia magna TaxID=35525 RepID=A0ABR0A8S7_9CRUS|nr:hypothetical protein OUZ56_003380 [Daphnia magna]
MVAMVSNKFSCREEIWKTENLRKKSGWGKGMGLGRSINAAAMELVSRRTCALQVRLAAACPTQALLGLQCVLECKLPKW